MKEQEFIDKMKKEFPGLNEKNNADIRDWLGDTSAFFEIGEVRRAPGDEGTGGLNHSVLDGPLRVED
jgi:hypothetical protein